MKDADKRLKKRSNTKNADISKKISENERQAFGRLIKAGICRELHEKKLINDEELNELSARFYNE